MSPNPIDDEELYNVIVLGGVSSPGIVTLTGHDRVIGWDVKKGAGQAGATTTRTSEDPVEFEASFSLVRDDAIDVDQISEWPAFLEVARSTIAGATPKALDIYHPDLAEVEIRSVVLKSIGGVVHDGKGGQIRKLRFLEYRPPKKKGGTPNGSKSKKPTTKAPDPNQAALDELAKLTAEYQKAPLFG